MIHYFISIDNTANPISLIDKRYQKPAMKTRTIAFCMHATGINRLFTREDVQEFLYRLGIILRKYRVVDHFFTNDILIDCSLEGEETNIITLDNLIENIGLETNDNPIHVIPREIWLEKCGIYWKNAAIMAIFYGMPLLAQKKIGGNTFEIGTQKPVFDDEYNKVAALFAAEALKTIGNAPFIALKKRVSKEDAALRIKQLERANEPLRVKYDYWKTPMEIKRKIFEHISGEHFTEEEFEEEVKEDKSLLASLIFLCWLWVNGYVTEYKISIGSRHSYYAEVDDRITNFNYDAFDGIGTSAGTNLWEAYYSLGLDKVSYMLKEPIIKGSNKIP